MKQPAYNLEAFSCPNCRVYAKQEWYTLQLKDAFDHIIGRPRNVFDMKSQPNGVEDHLPESDMAFAQCSSCDELSIWLRKELIFPRESIIEDPNNFMPEEVKKLYEEARQVFPISPRSSAALLRLALEVLLPSIGAKKGNINDMIGQLARESKTIARVSKAMDILRVTGNNAVHPGVLDLSGEDSRDTSATLFKILNIIVAETIESEAMVDEVYGVLPEGIQDSIEKRNAPRV